VSDIKLPFVISPLTQFRF